MVLLLIIAFLAVLCVTVFLKTAYHSGNGNIGITWLCIGDSITLGETNQNISYADYVGKLTGVHLIKEGYSGYTTERILSEIESIDAEADVITVFTGTNEWVYDVPVGDVDDRTPETFCGALNELMIYLKEKHPDAFIYFMTPLFRDMQYNPAIPFTGTVNSNGDGMDVYAGAVVSCAENNGINVIDMYRLSGINEKNIGLLTNDGTHPNAWGHLKIAWNLKAYIKTENKKTESGLVRNGNEKVCFIQKPMGNYAGNEKGQCMVREKIKKIPIIGYLVRIFVGIIRLPRYLDLLLKLLCIQDELKREQIDYQKNAEALRQCSEDQANDIRSLSKSIQEVQSDCQRDIEELRQWNYDWMAEIRNLQGQFREQQSDCQRDIEELRQWNYDRMAEIRNLQGQFREQQSGCQRDIEELRQWNYDRMAEIRNLQNMEIGEERIKKLNSQTSVFPTIWGEEARLHIAKTAAVGPCFFNTNSGTITIGEYTFAGSGVSILAGSHDMLLTGLLRRDAEITEGCDIRIGNGVWLGSNCTVLGPAIIGDNAVIAAGAVITPGTVVPDNTVYAGVPARYMRDLVYFEGDDADNPSIRKALERNEDVLFVKGWTDKRWVQVNGKSCIGHYQIENVSEVYTTKNKLNFVYMLEGAESCEIIVRIDDRYRTRRFLETQNGIIELLLDETGAQDTWMHSIKIEQREDMIRLFVANV